MEIKCRAWDKDEEKMYYSEGAKPYDIWFSLDNGKVECLKNYAYSDSFGDEHDKWEPVGEVELCTGKPDKNGKEIYQGDLIEVKTDKKHFITEIEWDIVSAGFLIKDSDNTYCGLDAITVFKNGSSSYGGCVEVIGNIHEKAGEK